jgi:hypothetical protein
MPQGEEMIVGCRLDSIKRVGHTTLTARPNSIYCIFRFWISPLRFPYSAWSAVGLLTLMSLQKWIFVFRQLCEIFVCTSVCTRVSMVYSCFFRRVCSFCVCMCLRTCVYFRIRMFTLVSVFVCTIVFGIRIFLHPRVFAHVCVVLECTRVFATLCVFSVYSDMSAHCQATARKTPLDTRTQQ